MKCRIICDSGKLPTYEKEFKSRGILFTSEQYALPRTPTGTRMLIEFEGTEDLVKDIMSVAENKHFLNKK